METRRQQAMQRKAEEEKARAEEEERKIRDENEKRKREREEHTGKLPVPVKTTKKACALTSQNQVSMLIPPTE